MRTDELEVPFDPSLVAREPAEPRDAARMMVLRRDARTIEHRRVRDLPDVLSPGDALVTNESRVVPARLKARRRGDGGAHVEGLLVERRGARTWLALLRNARRLREGESLVVEAPNGVAHGIDLVVGARTDDGWLVELRGAESGDAALARSGWTPLPPYILKARRDDGVPEDATIDALDRERYQTVFAHADELASVAAPTAGLHFTPRLLAALEARGVERIGVELEVGPGTFKAIETERVESHHMHRERCVVSASALARLRAPREGRIVAVGTTAVRTLESLPESPEESLDASGRLAFATELLITPGFRFRWTQALLTNFHLPRTTLIALVAAFADLEFVRAAYAEAIRERYRLFSFGDAMLIL